MPFAELPYSQLIASRPLLHGLAKTRIRVAAQVAVLQVIASIDAACLQLDRDRDAIIQANLDKDAPSSVPGSFNVTALGSHLIRVLESTPVKIAVEQIKAEDIAGLTATGSDLMTLRWFVTFPLATDTPVEAPVQEVTETPIDSAPEVVEVAVPTYEAAPAEVVPSPAG